MTDSSPVPKQSSERVSTDSGFVAPKDSEFTDDDVWLLRYYADSESCKCKYHGGGLNSLADRIAARLATPPKDQEK